MAAAISSYRERLDEFLKEDNYFTRGLGFVEAKTKVKKAHQFYVLVVLSGIYLLIGYAAALLCNFIGVVYPAYCSCKALETDDKDDDVQWLTYWVVFGLFTFVEFFSDIVLSWMPFYFLIKCAFLIWCMLPFASNGSTTIYNRVIRPYFLKYEKKLDTAVDRAGQLAGDVSSRVKDAAGNAASSIATDAIRQQLAAGDDTKTDKRD